MKPDRFLWALLIGIGLLVVAALAFFFLRGDAQEYGPDDTPENVVRNYALALHKLDYDRAYALLEDAEGKPDFEQFRAYFFTRAADPSSVGLSIQGAAVTGDQAVVDLLVIYTNSGPFVETNRSPGSALLLRDAEGAWKIASMPYPFWVYDWNIPRSP
jgi:hypothetical protein